MGFTVSQKVLFKHCDPAGIVFYPRIFEMLNDAVEALFADALDWPFETLHQSHAVPTATINMDFRAPSRHGDQLELVLAITRLGRSSLGLATTAHCDGELRFEATQTLVFIGPDGRPQPWPTEKLDRMTALKELAS